jgi:two-component system, response regulator PdtaR
MRVLIVEDDTFVGGLIQASLERLGHSVVGQPSDESHSIELFRKLTPELVIMDIRLNDTDGIELTRTLLSERAVPVVIVSAFSDNELIQRAAAAGVFGYLIKPVNDRSLAAAITIAVGRFSETSALQSQNTELAVALETRKLVDRAKGILIKRLKLAEPDAHRRLQSEAQKRRITMSDMAKKVIESEELLGR